jgi:uncharacterized protein YbjQ (UPF0145 family)
MKMISPSNREVDVGRTLSETEYIGMCRREVMDAYLRDRAEKLGANIVNGLMMKMEQPGGLGLRVWVREGTLLQQLMMRPRATAVVVGLTLAFSTGS